MRLNPVLSLQNFFLLLWFLLWYFVNQRIAFKLPVFLVHTVHLPVLWRNKQNISLNIEPSYLCFLSEHCIGTSGIFSKYLSSRNLKFSTFRQEKKRLLINLFYFKDLIIKARRITREKQSQCNQEKQNEIVSVPGPGLSLYLIRLEISQVSR